MSSASKFVKELDDAHLRRMREQRKQREYNDNSMGRLKSNIKILAIVVVVGTVLLALYAAWMAAFELWVR